MTEASDAENTAPRYVFVLIHGTFAPRAAWVQDETSLLRTTLERAFPNALFDSTFVWRGFLGTGLNNTHGYRIRAAHRLQKHLKELRAANPKAKIFAIAHSHGGNVLLYAAHDETVAPALDGAICMATPFFVTKADEGLLSVAQGWFTLIKSLFVFGGSLFVPIGIVFAIVLTYIKVSPLINHYIRIVLNFTIVSAALLISVAILLFLIVFFPRLEDAVEELTKGAQHRVETKLQASLPPALPVFCLLADGDEFGQLFRYCENAMNLVLGRWTTLSFLTIGVVLIALGNWLAFRSLAWIRTEAFNNGIITGMFVTAGASLICFTLSIAVVAVALLTLRAVVHRIATRLRLLIYGWENSPETLFSNIETTQVPPGHEVRPEQIDVRQAASRFRMIGATWIKHCEIYLNTDALDSMSAWVRLRSEHASAPCNACEKLKSENGRSLDEPLQHGASWLDGIGSSRHSGMRFN